MKPTIAMAALYHAVRAAACGGAVLGCACASVHAPAGSGDGDGLEVGERGATAGGVVALGGERAEPWWNDDATTQNDFYWLTVLDAQPRPHNNPWIHHHRKVVVDSDNNYPPWMEMVDGSRFSLNGERPIMMFALDGRGAGK